jgi:hypothetical protein
MSPRLPAQPATADTINRAIVSPASLDGSKRRAGRLEELTLITQKPSVRSSLGIHLRRKNDENGTAAAWSAA